MVDKELHPRFPNGTEVVFNKPPMRGFVISTGRRLNGTVVCLIDTPSGDIFAKLENTLEVYHGPKQAEELLKTG